MPTKIEVPDWLASAGCFRKLSPTSISVMKFDCVGIYHAGWTFLFDGLFSLWNREILFLFLLDRPRGGYSHAVDASVRVRCCCCCCCCWKMSAWSQQNHSDQSQPKARNTAQAMERGRLASGRQSKRPAGKGSGQKRRQDGLVYGWFGMTNSTFYLGWKQ